MFKCLKNIMLVVLVGMVFIPQSKADQSLQIQQEVSQRVVYRKSIEQTRLEGPVQVKPESRVNPIQRLDEGITLFFQGIRCAPLTLFFKLFIPLEIWEGVALIVLLFYFLKTKILRIPIISFVLARQLSSYGGSFVKHFFHRPRPFVTMHDVIPLTTAHGFSFPSGHASLGMALAVVLGYHFPKTRPWVYGLALLVGLSRVYLGVHYLTDVLGGFILGAIVGWIAILVERGIIILAQGVSFPKKMMMILFAVLLMGYNPCLAQNKDESQDQIILLNDSASALEDSNPELSKSLTQLADEKQKDKDIPISKDKTKLLKAAALEIKGIYPQIAINLEKMAKEIDGTNKNEK